MTQTTKIFLAYSRKDSEYLNEFKTHIAPIERSGEVTIWYDGKIVPGSTWETEIKDRLHNADIILLLVSANSIASDYFYNKEMKDALVRHSNGSARVVPLILRPCAWKATPLSKLQAIPKNGKAVTSWEDRDEAYSDAVTQLWNMINSIQINQTKENDGDKGLKNEIKITKTESDSSEKPNDNNFKEETLKVYIIPAIQISLFTSYLVLIVIPWISFESVSYIVNITLAVVLFFVNKSPKLDKYLVILSIALFAIVSILKWLTESENLSPEFPLKVFISLIYLLPIAFMVRLYMKSKKL